MCQDRGPFRNGKGEKSILKEQAHTHTHTHTPRTHMRAPLHPRNPVTSTSSLSAISVVLQEHFLEQRRNARKHLDARQITMTKNKHEGIKDIMRQSADHPTTDGPEVFELWLLGATVKTIDSAY